MTTKPKSSKLLVKEKTIYSSRGENYAFTVKELQSISTEFDGYHVHDTDGLFGTVRILKRTNTVSISFKYAFGWNNKIEWFPCGTYPKQDIARIRQQRDWAKEQLRKGINPREAKKSNRIEQAAKNQQLIAQAKLNALQEKTFADLFQSWLDYGLMRQNNNQEIIASFNRHLIPKLGNKPIRLITMETITDIFKNIKSKGTQKYPRNRTIIKLHSELHQLFVWAQGNPTWANLLINGIPTAQLNIKKLLDTDYESHRTRILTIDELHQLQNQINAEKKAYKQAIDKRNALQPLNEHIQCAIWIALSTMCRIGELMLARWEHIDFDKKTWFIPIENVKGVKGKKSAHTVYLSEFSIEQFQKLKNLEPKSDWCFPSQKQPEKHVCLKSYSKIIGDRQIGFKERNKAAIGRRHDNSLAVGNDKWTFHDLRRTGSTLMQQLKIAPHIINLCQNHEIRNAIDKSYQQYSYEPEMKEAWQKLGDFIDKKIIVRESILAQYF